MSDASEQTPPSTPLSPLEAAMAAAAGRKPGEEYPPGEPESPAEPVAVNGSAQPGDAQPAETGPAEAGAAETADVDATPAEPEAASAEPDAGDEEWTPGDHRLIPLLPRGRPLFDTIPSRAVVLEALSPAVVDGAVIFQAPDQVGVVLIRGGGIDEKYAFTEGRRFLGAAALQRIKSWTEATVSAFQFPAPVVAIAPSLLRGEPVYEELHLEWADWPGLLADLRSRGGTFAIELDTPRGRGVTCVHEGEQIATYTDAHPELGEPTLLDALAAARRGTIWVLRAPSVSEDEAAAALHPDELTSTAAVDAPATEAGEGEAAPGSAPDWLAGAPDAGWGADDEAADSQAAEPEMPAPAASPFEQAAANPFGQPAANPFDQPAPAANPFAQPAANPFDQPAPAANPFAQPAANPFDQPAPAANPFAQPTANPFAQPAPAANPFAPAASGTQQPAANPFAAAPSAESAGGSVQELLPDLKLIARSRLQRSAARVEAMLDEAAEQNRPVDSVLQDIRGLVIRGVMQSTLDEVVDEMSAAARRKSA